MSAPNRPRNTTELPSNDSGGEVIANGGGRGMKRVKPRIEWTPMELARGVVLSRRTAHSDVTAGELEVFDALVRGEISITAAGVGVGAEYRNASAAVGRLALRVVLAGYYSRNDKEAPKP